MAAKITGRVTGVFFDEGMHVKNGQILATLDDSDVKRALDSAVADRNSTRAQITDYQVQLRNAEIELHRANELLSAGVQSQEALDNARTSADSLKAKIALTKEQVAASEARINEAQQAVDNCVIRAPFEGIIVSKDAQVGEMISPVSAGGGFTRTGVATIVDMNSNEIEVDVNEAYIARVETGPAGHCSAGRVPGLADSLESSHGDSDSGPPESYSKGSDFILKVGPEDFAGHGDQGDVSGRRAGQEEWCQRRLRPFRPGRCATKMERRLCFS